MANRSFFLGTEAQLFTGGGIYSTKIGNSPTSYGLVASEAAALSDSYTAFASAYEAAIAPETRTKAKVAAKNAAKIAFRALAADLARKIDGTSTVTDEQRIELGLAVRRKPSPLPPLTARASVDLLSMDGRTATVQIHDAATGSKRKPAGAIAAWVYSYVGATYPDDPTAWQFEGACSKGVHRVTFPETAAPGAQVWICAAWVTRSGVNGPISAPVSAHLQIGGLGSSTLKLAA